MNILTVAAHPDDEIVGCGGAMSRFREHVVTSVYFSPCPEEGHSEDYVFALEALNVNRLVEYEFPQDVLEQHSQEVRDLLWKLREEICPDVVLCPSPHDFHQDHRVVANACMTIFRDTSTILGYEVLRSSNSDFSPNMYVILNQEDVDMKLTAFSLLKAQKEARPWFWNPDRILANMRMRGTQVKSEYAEAYELLWGRI